MNNGIKVAIVMLMTMLLGVTSVLAEPLSDQLQTQQNKLQQDKNQLKGVWDKREEMETRIENMDVQIEGLMSEIDKNKSQISQVEKDIKNTEADVKKTEQEVENDKELLGERVKAMYITGTGGYISILFNSKNVGDFISRIELIKKIIDFDNKTIQELNNKQKELNGKKEALNQKKEGLLVLKKSNEEKLLTMNNSIQEERKLIDDVKKQEKLFAANVNQSQVLVNATLSQIQQIRKTVPKYSPSRGAAQVSSNAVIAYASNFLGTPYVWGGTTPVPGFDCSGFVQYVYAHFGIQLGRTTWDQINDGVAVSRDQLQPGDIVFFGEGGNPTHEGIYLGNNTYINAPRTGDVVKIAPTTRSDYITARRVTR